MDKLGIGEDFTPNPINLLLANRNIGYTLEEAIADLIDNSISAGSSNIWLKFDWNEGAPIFSITDDGCGMNCVSGELASSFKLATKNPRTSRNEADLGRYGSGMKTASLSQARSFVVISKPEYGQIGLRSLDIDFIEANGNKWILKIPDANKYQIFTADILKRGHGTTLIWENWDRHPGSYEEFNLAQDKVLNYISVCFHRFLSAHEHGANPSLNIHFQTEKNPIPAISPIPEPSSERSVCRLKDEQIVERAYLIPHPSTWEIPYNESQTFNSYKLFNGYEQHQGIYIYRCNRLLNPYGGWLGLAKASNGTKLARITIDFPNHADDQWQLDITKTKAKIPLALKAKILEFITTTQIKSREKITRGSNTIRPNIRNVHATIWKQKKIEDLYITYEVNEKYVGFETLFKNSSTISQSTFKSIIKLISDNLPIQEIIDNHEINSNSHDFNRQSIISEFQLELAYNIYLSNTRSGVSHSRALQDITMIEPYCYDDIKVKEYINGRSK